MYVLRCKPKQDPLDSDKRSYNLKNSAGNSSTTTKLLKKYCTHPSCTRVQVIDNGDPYCPLYLELARHAERTYYVGQTSNLKERVKLHEAGTACDFTADMEVSGVEYIESVNRVNKGLPFIDDVQEWAKKREKQIAEKINNQSIDNATYSQDGSEIVDPHNIFSFAHYG